MSTVPHVAINASFMEWLIQHMADSKLSRRELAQRTGMSDATVKAWFRGVTPQRETVNAIAAAFDADVLEAQRAAGHLPQAATPLSVEDGTPLTPQEIALLRDILRRYDMERQNQIARMLDLVADISPSAWRRLRALGEALERIS